MVEAVLAGSAGGLLLLANLTLAASLAAALATKGLFLGELSAAESGAVAERLLRFAVPKLVFLVAAPAPSGRDAWAYAAWTLAWATLRTFTGLARDRCAELTAAPSSSPLQHVRALALLAGILAQGLAWVHGAWAHARGGGGLGSNPAALLWLYDSAAVAAEAAHALLVYGLQAGERWRALRPAPAGAAPPGPWEWRGSMQYHADLAADLVLHALALAHYTQLWRMHGEGGGGEGGPGVQCKRRRRLPSFPLHLESAAGARCADALPPPRAAPSLRAQACGCSSPTRSWRCTAATSWRRWWRGCGVTCSTAPSPTRCATATQTLRPLRSPPATAPSASRACG